MLNNASLFCDYIFLKFELLVCFYCYFSTCGKRTINIVPHFTFFFISEWYVVLSIILLSIIWNYRNRRSCCLRVRVRVEVFSLKTIALSFQMKSAKFLYAKFLRDRFCVFVLEHFLTLLTFSPLSSSFLIGLSCFHSSIKFDANIKRLWTSE